MHSIKLVLALAVSVAAVGSAVAAPLALAPGDVAPPVRGTDIVSGEFHVLDWSESDFTLLNFWATWCVPCQEEMPALAELHERLGERLRVVGINQQDISAVELQSFLVMLGVNYPVILAHREVARDWRGISALPASFLVDREGKIVRRYVGATKEQIAGLVADMEAALAGRPLPPIVIPTGTEGRVDPNDDYVEMLKEKRDKEPGDQP